MNRRAHLTLIIASTAAVSGCDTQSINDPGYRQPGCIYRGDTLGTLHEVDASGAITKRVYLIYTKPVPSCPKQWWRAA
jgi:hypothetical protein